MTRDPLGHDPLGIDPVAIVQQHTQTRSQIAFAALREGIVFRDVYIIPNRGTAESLAPCAPPVSDDGTVLTLEKRIELAKQRVAYVPIPFGDPMPAKAEDPYRHDLQDRQVVPIGETGQKIIDLNPDIRALPGSAGITHLPDGRIQLVTGVIIDRIE